MPTRRGRSELGRIVLWSGVSNFVLTLLFIASANWAYIRSSIGRFASAQNTTTVVMTFDALAMSRLWREDLLVQGQSVQSETKVSLNANRAVSRSTDDAAIAAIPADGEGLEPGGESFSSGGPETVMGGLGSVPLIQMNSGKIVIGTFKPMTLAGDSGECLDVAQSIIQDSGAPPEALEVIATSEAITIAKICARNGSVIFSCRNQEITISPRRPRPDDMCQRTG